MRRRLSSDRAIQIGLLFLLVVSACQVVWWILDQVVFTAEMVATAETHFRHDLDAASLLMAKGMQHGEIERVFPHLRIGDEGPVVRSATVDALTQERRRRLRQYAWEGAFFLLVLGLSMMVLWRALKQQSDLRKRQQNFIAAVSHEFKSPLASLQLSAETLAMRELDSQRRRTLVERILEDIHRMEGMATKILNASSLEQGRLEMRPEPLWLASVVDGVIDGLEVRAQAGDVVINTAIDADLRIQGDPVATRTVVQNLVENAIKATTAAGGGRITVRGTIHGGRVELEVRDTGIGFPPEESRKIFEKFYRSGDEMRRVSPGTGLGLYIVHRLMHSQKGGIQSHSSGPGKGAVFTAMWPAAAEGEG